MDNTQSAGCGDVGCYKHSYVKCLSWTAVIAGALVALGIGFLLNIFGMAIGLAAFTTTDAGIITLAVGGYVGMIVSVIVAMFVAGWVSGYLGRVYCANRNLGVLYGFVTWCLALVFTILLASSISRYVSAHYYSLTNPHSSMVVMNSDSSVSPTISERGKINQEVTTSKQATANDEKVAKALSISLFATFILFFIGALASCFGGYCGISCCKKEDGCEVGKPRDV